MKTITLTDEQFDTLFDYVDNKVQFIVDASVKHQDSEILEEWEDFVIEVSEWGIYELGGVDFDTLTSNDIERLNQFQKNQSSEEAI